MTVERIPQPRELSIYMTEKCNLGCWFCRRTIHGEGDAPDVAPPLVIKMLDRFPSLKSSCLAGFGEPLLNPHLYDLLALLKGRGLFVSIITNGILLGKHMDRLGASKVDMISVSLNAANAAAYQAMGGVAAFDVVTRNIGDMVRAAFCDVHVSFVVEKKNYRSVPELIDLMDRLGVLKVDLLNLLPHADIGYDDKDFWARVLTAKDGDVCAFFDTLKAAHPRASIVNRWPVLFDPDNNPSICDSPWVHIGLDGAGLMGGCRRVVPPSADGLHCDSDGAWDTDFHHVTLRNQLSGREPMKDVCRMCWGNWSKP